MSKAHDSAKLRPRVIRCRDTPYYLGMGRKQEVSFDRLELNAWSDEYARNEPSAQNVEPWNAKGTHGIFKRSRSSWDIDISIRGRRIGQSPGSASLTDAERISRLFGTTSPATAERTPASLDKQGHEVGIQGAGAWRISSVNA
jgi:hypothetical protein